MCSANLSQSIQNFLYLKLKEISTKSYKNILYSNQHLFNEAAKRPLYAFKVVEVPGDALDYIAQIK